MLSALDVDSSESALGAEFFLTKSSLYDIMMPTATRPIILEPLQLGKRADSLRLLEAILTSITTTVFVSRKPQAQWKKGLVSWI